MKLPSYSVKCKISKHQAWSTGEFSRPTRIMSKCERPLIVCHKQLSCGCHWNTKTRQDLGMFLTQRQNFYFIKAAFEQQLTDTILMDLFFFFCNLLRDLLALNDNIFSVILTFKVIRSTKSKL